MRRKKKPPEIQPIEVEPLVSPNPELEKKESRGKRAQQKQNKQNPQELPNQCSQHTLVNALLMEKKGELRYEEILRKAEKDASVKELGDSGTKICKTVG